MPTHDPWGVAGVADAPNAPPASEGQDEWGIHSVADAAPAAPGLLDRAKSVLTGAVHNIGELVGATGDVAQANPEFGGPVGQVPTPRQIQRVDRAAEQPMVPLANAFPERGALRGVAQGLEAVTIPKNVATVAGLAVTAPALPEVGYAAVAAKALNAGLGAYFTYEMGRGAAQNVNAAYQSWQQRDYPGVAQALGLGSVEALFAAFGAKHLQASARAIATTKVPRPALRPEVVPPEAAPAAEALASGPAPTIDVQSNADVPASVAEPANDPVRPADPVAALEHVRQNPDAKPAELQKQFGVTYSAARKLTQLARVERAAAEATNVPVPVPEAPASEVNPAPEPEPTPQTAAAPLPTPAKPPEAPEAAASDWQVAKVEDAPAPDAAKDSEPAPVAALGDWQVAKIEDAPSAAAAPVRKGKDKFFPPPAVAAPAEVERETASERGVSHYGSETSIAVPGDNTNYRARYALRELAAVEASHNGQNFEPNPAYEHRNDRDYAKAANAERVVRQAQAFDPAYLINDNPDAVNGPPVIDKRGNVLGGNSRTMTLGRVYAGHPEAADRYRELLAKKADSFGIDPAQVQAMQQPVLVREAGNIDNPQNAITDFNKTGTAALTSSERAVSDARRVAGDTLEYLGRRIADEGDDATLAKVLGGAKGPAIVNRLVADGVLTPQEKPQYVDERGLVTPEGKQRIARLMVGQFFDSPDEFDRTAPELRQKLERVVAPLSRVQDRPEWDVTPTVKQAIGILTEAKARGVRHLDDLEDQRDLFGRSAYEPQALAVAKTLQQGPRKAADAFQQYASDADIGRQGDTFGFLEPPTPEESFEAAFGSKEHAGVAFAKELNHEMTPDLPEGKISPDLAYRHADWEVLPEKRENRPVRLRLNRQALDLLADAVTPGDKIDGFSMIPGEPERFAREVELYAMRQYNRKKIGIPALTHAVRFAKALEALNGQRLIGYVSDGSYNLAWKAHTLREELIHWEQRKLGPNQDGIAHLDARAFASDRLFPSVRAALLKNGYKDDPEILAMEAGAKLGAGETFELGLTARGARTLLREYYRLLMERNGEEKARQVLRFAPRIVRRELQRAALSQKQGRSGRDRTVPPGEPTFSRNANNGKSLHEHSARVGGEGRGPAVSETVRRLRAGRPGGDGPAVRRDVPGDGLFAKQRKPDGRDDRTGSLFDSATGDQVASEAARDRDTLEGSRLTAQLNAPLTREEQLKKLKRSQTDPQSSLFEDNSPAQGSLFLGSGLGALQPVFDRFWENDIVPTARQLAELVHLSKDDFAKVLAPASRGDEAKTAALSVRAHAAELARATARVERALAAASKYFDSIPEQERWAFIDAVEQGQPQKDPTLDGIAQTMRTILDTRREAMRQLGTGKLRNFIEDYFPHLWKQPAKAAEVFANGGKRPLEGSKSFLKQRTIATFAEGLAAGLEPVSTNPVDLVLAKAREMDKYLMAHRILTELKDRGLAQWKGASDNLPVGYVKIEDSVAKRWGKPSHAGALQLEGEYVAPEPVARVLNNYLSPGLRERSGAFRAYLGVGNLLNQAQLGFSAFHLAFTTIDVATSRVALGLYQGAKGDVWRGVKTIATTPVSPVTNVLLGDKVLKEYYAPGTQGSRIAALVDALVQAGGRARMDSFYETQLTKRMMQAWRAGNLLGAGLRAPFALFEQSARPLMEYLVPRQKLGVFANLAQYELDRLGPNAGDDAQRAALARVWDSVDNRLGQMVYDNLFWHKMMKDLAMASVRSVGWNLGTIREVAGGAADTAAFAKAKLTGAGEAEFTHRMSYIVALPFVAGLMGGILYYYWHGKAPEHAMDYFLPRDRNGHRWNLPTYMKDVFHWGTDPVGTATGKVHPLLTTMIDMLQNQDYFHHPIANPHHPLTKRAEELAAYALRQFTPMSLRPPKKKGHVPTTEEKILPVFGVTRASKSLDQLGRH